MKKVFSTVVALALVSSITATASAVNNVWFQANGPAVSGGTAVCGGGLGGPGSQLDLTMDGGLGGGTCTWPIRLMLDYQGDGGDDGIVGWALDLFTDASPSKLSATFGSYGSAGAFPSANEFAPGASHPDGPNGLLTGKGRVRTDGASNPFGSYALMDFTITKTKGIPSTLQDSYVWVVSGTGAWGVSDPNFAQFSGQYAFGPNAPTSENGAGGTAIGSGPGGAMIWIHNVPEPATLSLFVLGGLALIRRRR